MYELIKDYRVDRNTRMDSPRFPNVSRMMKRDTQRLIAYYQLADRIVPNDHLLVEILKQLNVSMTRELGDYVDKCFIETERLAKLFGLIHPDVYDVEIRHGLFYNNGISEFIIADESDFDFYLAYKRWQEVVPLKVFYHPFTDLNASILNGNYKNPIRETGYAVFYLNIPLLAIQFRAWLENTDGKDIKQFVHAYPITNCIKRHQELALVNRTIHLHTGKPVAKFFRCHPIALADYNGLIDEVILDRINILKNGNFKLDQFFNLFTGYNGHSWKKMIAAPNMAPLRNTKWAMELQSMPYVQYWLWYKTTYGIDGNMSEINNLRRHLRNLRNDNGYYKDSKVSISNYLDDFSKLLESVV